MQFTIQVPDAARITAAFAAAPAMVLDELEITMGSVMLYLQRETVDGTPKQAGTLRAAFITHVDVIASLDAVFGRLTNPLPYALPVELGTRPHRPPLEPLMNWVEAKFGVGEYDLMPPKDGKPAITGRQFAWLIQRNIGRYGSPGMGMAHYALRDGRETIQAEFAECAARIVARLEAMGNAGGAVNGGGAA
jgi:hypothetical protein